MKLNIFSKKEGSIKQSASSEDVNYLSGKRPKETWRETHTGISFPMILYIGWKNLKANKTRSILTIGGVALGIGIVTFLLSMGFGMQKMIVAEVTKNNPLDVIDINNGNLDNFVSINNEAMEKIKGMEGVREVSRQVNAGGKIILGESQTDVVIYGTTDNYLKLARINYKSNGGNFSDTENNAIISDRLANLLGFENAFDAIGKKIIYNIALTKDISSQISEEKVAENSETTVFGIVSGADSSFMYLPYGILEEKFSVDSAQMGKVVIADMTKFVNVKQQLEQTGFITESINDLIKDIDSFFNTIRAILAVFGIVIMSISVMGMLNTLSISLLQRTKEIGILKALGTKRYDVFKMFVLESIIISFTGGILGFLGGYGFALLINQILFYFGKRAGVELAYFVYIPPVFIAALAGFIIFLGISTGIMPAFRASKIHALEALRYE